MLWFHLWLVDIPPLHSWNALPGMVPITHLWMLVGSTGRGTASTDGWTSRRIVAIWIALVTIFSNGVLIAFMLWKSSMQSIWKDFCKAKVEKKMYNRSFLSIGKSRCNNTCMYLYFESYTKLPVLRGCIHNQGGLKIRRLLCEYSRGISFL